MLSTEEAFELAGRNATHAASTTNKKRRSMYLQNAQTIRALVGQRDRAIALLKEFKSERKQADDPR